jgi:phosphoenolpyruvate carboxykinase (ATP)
MMRHPSVYARLLAKKIEKHHVNCWLVNTGWTGGGYGVGSRMKIEHTRALMNAALDGSFEKVEMQTDPIFGFLVPSEAPGVPLDILNPRKAWSNTSDYDANAKKLAVLFHENFDQFKDESPDEVIAAGPKIA